MINYFFIFFHRLRNTSQQRWLLTILFFFSVLAYSSTGFMYFEIGKRPDLQWSTALWWAIVTMTTVGYGDWAPITPKGQFLVGLPTMIVGVSVLGYILSMLASTILESKIKEIKGMTTIKNSGHIIICRFNNLEGTLKIVEEIRKDNSTSKTHIVLIDENIEELPRELVERDVSFVKGSPSRDKILEQANLAEANHVIIRSDESDKQNSDNNNIAIALNIEKLKPEVFSVVECLNPENVKIFERAGCNSVVCIANLNYQMIVQELQDPGTHSVCAELTSNTQGKQFYIVNPPPEATDYGKLQLHYPRFGALALGLRRGSENILFPEESETIKHGDKVILIGKDRPS